LWKADSVVFQSPVHPGGGLNADGVTLAAAAGAALTAATAAGSARASTAAPAATGMRCLMIRIG